MKQNLNLNWLRTFEAAARHLSFTAASHELGLTQTAVSQHIKGLETKLGQNLFIRTDSYGFFVVLRAGYDASRLTPHASPEVIRGCPQRLSMTRYILEQRQAAGKRVQTPGTRPALA